MKIFYMIVCVLMMLLEIISLGTLFGESVGLAIALLILAALGMGICVLLYFAKAKLPRFLSTFLKQTILFGLIYRGAETCFYAVTTLITFVSVAFLHNYNYGASDKGLGYLVIFCLFATLLAYYIIACIMWKREWTKEKPDWFSYALLPQMGLAFAQFIIPSGAIVAHMRMEQSMEIVNPIWVVWLYLAEAITLIVLGIKVLKARKHQ